MIHNRKVIALVPIKDHSERVVKKNFREFSGKPLYHHILETLQKTYAIDEILINTDSLTVRDEAPKLFGKVKVLMRPKELTGDFVSVNKLIAFDMANSEGDIYIQTHATNPLLKAETIAKALKKFVENEDEGKADSLFSVNRFKSRFYDKDRKPVNHNPDELLRTQDLPPLYEENSCIYIFTKKSFSVKGTRIGEKAVYFETPKVESVDIDDEFTFKLAEILALYSK
jgi:CMP-N-acetylneuraminic acid synthetase